MCWITVLTIPRWHIQWLIWLIIHWERLTYIEIYSVTSLLEGKYCHLLLGCYRRAKWREKGVTDEITEKSFVIILPGWVSKVIVARKPLFEHKGTILGLNVAITCQQNQRWVWAMGQTHFINQCNRSAAKYGTEFIIVW